MSDTDYRTKAKLFAPNSNARKWLLGAADEIERLRENEDALRTNWKADVEQFQEQLRNQDRRIEELEKKERYLCKSIVLLQSDPTRVIEEVE